MELKQLYTDLILEYNKDKTNKRKIENPMSMNMDITPAAAMISTSKPK